MGMRGFNRGGLKVGLAAAALFAGFARPATAAPIPGFSTLDQLITAGPAGVTIGNYQFYDFSYQGIPTGGPNPAPTAAQISVGAPDDSSIGLDFSAGWASIGGYDQESKIIYKVHAINNAPFQFIFGVGVSFNGSTPVPSAGTFAQETDTLTDTSGNAIANLPPIVILDDGSPASVDSAMSAAINPSLQDIRVSKDILVHSASGNGVSTISVSNNTFVTPVLPAPEPASIGIFALAGLGLLGRRRRA